MEIETKKVVKKVAAHGILNSMKLEISALGENESFARTVVAAFAAQLNPTLEEINDLKTAVSEAVTNCVVHAYSAKSVKALMNKSAIGSVPGKILIECVLFQNRTISVSVTDFGIGIANIQKALEPFFTSKPEQERSGMGFTVMQSFMDSLKVVNGADCGTIVEMTKIFG